MSAWSDAVSSGFEFDAEFDAAMCVDGMEYVFPEDWPLVLSNLCRAVRTGGLVYLTIEKIDPAEIATVYEEAKAAGLPVVHGENIRRGGGYHHYPTPDRVADGPAEARPRGGRRRGQSRDELRLPPRSGEERASDPSGPATEQAGRPDPKRHPPATHLLRILPSGMDLGGCQSGLNGL